MGMQEARALQGAKSAALEVRAGLLNEEQLVLVAEIEVCMCVWVCARARARARARAPVRACGRVSVRARVYMRVCVHARVCLLPFHSRAHASVCSRDAAYWHLLCHMWLFKSVCHHVSTSMP